MSFAECISLALSSLRTNKMRALLTLLGVIIGIAAVITIVTLGKALETQTANSLASAGINDFTVRVEPRSAETDENAYGSIDDIDADNKISIDMIEDMRSRLGEQLDGIAIGEFSNHRGNVQVDSEKSATSLMAVNDEYFRLKGVKIQAGRAFNEEDIAGDRQVTVLSPELLDKLFDGDTSRALGSEVDFTSADGTSVSFTVIGVYQSDDGGVLVGGFTPSVLYVPWPSEQRIDDVDEVWDVISVRPSQDMDSDKFKDTVQKYFDDQYENNEDYKVKVTDLSKQLAELNTMLATVSLVVSAIGGISLLVGGIGVMNIMLVTVTERTREIGIRKALGATRRDIRIQFIVESMIVGLLGGIIGVLLGSGFGVLGSYFMKTVVSPPISGILVALLFSLGVGLFFGYYPANKAAKLNPIDALRHE